MHAPANRKIHPDRNLISRPSQKKYGYEVEHISEWQTVVWSLFQNS